VYFISQLIENARLVPPPPTGFVGSILGVGVLGLRGDPPQQNAKKRQYGPKIIFNVSKRA